MTVETTDAHHARAPLPGTPDARRFDRHAVLVLGLAGAFVACWPLVLRSFGGDGVYASLGMYGLLILVTLILAGRRPGILGGGRLGTNVLLGVAVGVGMTVATYVAYRACVALFPSLAPHVQGLYAATRATRVGSALLWTMIVVGAEEILWRGPIFDVVRRGAHRSIVVALSLATYTAVQLGTGSGIVALAAFVCGAIWTAERLLTRSMVAPLISHAIWTLTVIHLLPVTSV